MTTRRDSERGAILVYVAIAIVALMSFSAFVLDYGVFWVARHQAQNAADAGALAGTFAQVFEEPDTPGALTLGSATAAAMANKIFGEDPAVEVTTDPGTCPAYAASQGDTCVRVAIYRDAAHSNPLPTYFSRLLGVTTLGVQATATAQLRPANTTNCVKPLMLPDVGGVYSSRRRRRSPPPSPGYTLDAYGHEVILDPSVSNKSTPGYFAEFDAGQGGGLRSAIAETCPSSYGSHQIQEVVPTSWSAAAQNEAVLGLQDLIDQDPGAYWDGSVNAVRGSCAPGCGAHSPRIITLALFNPAATPGGSLFIRNFLPVFVSSIDAAGVHLFITPSIGTVSAGSMPLPDAGFLNIVAVIR